MRITVNTFGTRGDVQPYIALSLGLKQNGHSVRIVTHQVFESFVKGRGLDFYPLAPNPRQVLVSQALSELGNNTLRITRWLKENFRSTLRDVFEATLDANRDTDLMLNSALSFAGWHVGEKLGIPALAAYLWPVTPSRHLPATTGEIPPDWLPFRGAVNYWSTRLSNQLFFNLLLSLTNQCREEVLNLRPLRPRDYWPLDSARTFAPIIYGYSPAVVPKPPDWRDQQQVTGYWFLDTPDDYEPNRELDSFLADGPPPVAIGFGSLVEHEGEAVNQLVIDALEETGQRGVLLGGWSELGLGELPDSVFRVDAVPHDWLFPQTAAVVHHGGAGTLAAGLRAGVPTVVVPSFGDQFFWGWRVAQLGAGPKPISRKELTTPRLASAIQLAIDDEAKRERAAQIGQQIRAEDGVGTAVRMIEGFARDGRL